jgi:aminoglycoside phosphotransferase (APT) family kinase protein
MDALMISPTRKADYVVTDEEMIDSLNRVLNGHGGCASPVVHLNRRLSDYCSSYTIEELEVGLADGTTLSLVFKDLSWSALIREAQGVKPEFLYNPIREMEMYGALLSPFQWGIARYYGSHADPLHGQYWLFLEHVPGDKLRFVGEFEVWRQAARWLARLHATFRLEPGRLETPAGGSLVRYDSRFYHRWMERAQAYLRRIDSERTRENRQRFDELADRYDRVVSRLTALPPTLLHGDFFASNVLLVKAGEASRICPLDWEMSALGPGGVDLAALIAGGWTEAERADLAGVYYDSMTRAGVPMESPEEFARSLEYCRLHLAVQWLGWSTDWTPPSEERQDWLLEALGIAERLELL